MFTFVVFLAVIAVLVLSHEFGHFVVAKWKGMRVDEFGFGFPPRLFGKQFGETLYSINLLPFGGFVRIWGEDETGKGDEFDMRNFASHGAWDRFLVLIAGVAMNLILAYVLLTIGHGIGIPSAVGAGEHARNAVVRVVEVVPGSPAQEAGMMLGDAIIELESPSETMRIEEVANVQEFVKRHAGEKVVVVVGRSDGERRLAVALREEAPAGEGLLGIAMAKIGIVRTPWYRAPWEGLKTTIYTTKAVAGGLASFFANIFSSDIAESVAGPVGIAQIAGEATRLGFVYLLQLVAVLSINLAILNVLPIPALDGGRIFFLVIEKLRGAPISMRVSQFAHTAGFIVLVFLMLVVTYFDLTRIF